MNEIFELAKAAPQSVVVGATVYLVLAVRRLDNRVDDIANQVGCQSRRKRRRGIIAAISILALAALMAGCTMTRRCTKAGCTTTLSTSTNSVPLIREFGKWFR